MKTPNKLICSLLLFIAALVWGISFVTQSIGGVLLGAYAFNAARMLLGALVVSVCIWTFGDRTGLSAPPVKGKNARRQLLTGILCGVFLAAGTNLQQVALNAGTSAGKAGFITAFYIILVPVLALLFHRKARILVWIAVLIALAGLYFLCISGSFALSTADLLLLLCAVAFACQILVIDIYGKGLDGLRLAAMEFWVCGLISAVLAVIFEILPYPGGFGSWISLFSSGQMWINLLYMGFFSCGVGYTFQILGQSNLDPSVASVIMSLESVFSVLSGWILLGQVLSGREILGCVLMFAAVILAQLPERKKSKGAVPSTGQDACR